MIKAILFDLDGTLIDTEYRTANIKAQLLKDYGFEVNDEILSKLIGKKLARQFPILFPDYPETDKLLADYDNRAYGNIDYTSLVKKNAEELLLQLKDKYKMALVTTSWKSKIDEIKKQLNWYQRFDTIVMLEDVTKPKPDAEPYLLAMERLGLNANECIAVEDTGVGISSAKAAGLKVICINESRYPTNQAGADYYINDLLEVIDIVK